MNKLIRDGKVAILITRGYGAGWYSWHSDEDLLFDPTIVLMIENKTPHETIRTYCREKFPDASLGGIENLKVYWIPVGTEFQIDEYDGQESIRFRNRESWLIA